MDEINNEVVDWLKNHSLKDMKDLAQEMSTEGEDVSDLVDVINELEEISRTEGIEIAV
jgi:hypothetical protein